MHCKIANKILENGFECYIVGGAVRDQMMGKFPNDFDLATNAKPKDIENIFSGEKINFVGKSFGVFRVNDIEVATLRKDFNIDENRQNCFVEYSERIEEDLARRDLTINAMAIDMKTNELIDPFNGKEDIKNRSINFVGNPSDRIREDYLRILRAIRFRTIIGGEYEEKTKESIHSSCHLIRNISKERIRTEILKTLVVQKASRFFRDLHEFDILEYIFPSLEKCFDHYNGVYHHTDVFNHSMICGDALSTKNKLLKLAGYLHDVGKPPSYVMNNEENFANHEMMSYELVREELSNLKFSNDEIDFISNVIKHHMRNIMVSPLFTISKKSFKKTLFNLEKDNVNFKDLVRLKIGDRRGNHKKFPYLKQEIRETLSLYDEMIKNPSVSPTGLKSLNINGEDIISLGFKEGPIIGRILNDCLNAILEEKLTNEKGELKEYIKTQFG